MACSLWYTNFSLGKEAVFTRNFLAVSSGWATAMREPNSVSTALVVYIKSANVRYKNPVLNLSKVQNECRTLPVAFNAELKTVDISDSHSRVYMRPCLQHPYTCYYNVIWNGTLLVLFEYKLIENRETCGWQNLMRILCILCRQHASSQV